MTEPPRRLIAPETRTVTRKKWVSCCEYQECPVTVCKKICVQTPVTCKVAVCRKIWTEEKVNVCTYQCVTEQQKVIAEYWSDGPNSELPPGHWCLFAQMVSEHDVHTDDEDVKMFFALSNAVADAGIAA